MRLPVILSIVGAISLGALLTPASVATQLLTPASVATQLLTPAQGQSSSAAAVERKVYYKIAQDNTGVPSIYFSDEIGDTQAYQPLIQYIESHHDVPGMKVYLAGNGGNAFALVELVTVMRASPTQFTAVVYGDVYSAHAFLAINLDKLVVLNPSILFLFHQDAYTVGGTGVLGDVFCDLTVPPNAVDRGVSALKKCKAFQKASAEEFKEIILPRTLKVLTPSEIKRYWEGDDVIVKAKDVKERLSK